MADGIDPRLKAIMDKLNKSAEKKAQEQTDDPAAENEPPKPPTTFEEFIKAEKLNEWPYRITSENILDLSAEKQVMGSLDDIKEELHNATMLDMTVLNNLENRLKKFEKQINAVGNQVIVEQPESLGDTTPLPMSVSRAFLTETKQGDIMKVHPSRKKKKSDFKEETRGKTVEYCSFPGFRPGELTELPRQLEAPQILNRVTKAQDFNPGLKKFWKKIFQSEASVAMMQDAFWWFFIDNFEKKRQKEQSKLFDRLADSFVALFTSINPEIKDKIFLMYADSLCQAMYVAFIEAFPESTYQFQDEFKQKLVDTICEWITGIPPSYGSWSHWDMKRLQIRSSKPTMADSSTQVNNNVRDLAVINTDQKQTLPMADFHRTMQQLGNQNHMATVLNVATNINALVSREATKVSINGPDGTTLAVPVTTLAPLNQSRQAQCGTPRRAPVESSCMGRGPEVERVLFNLKGRSPLVAHFLHMRQLRDNKPLGRKVRRTQILKPPPETKTYRDLIRETTEVQKKLSEEYTRICDMTQNEINKIEKQQRETTRRIDELQRNITNCRSSMEIKMMGEKLLDSKDWDMAGPLSSRQATEVKALMQKDKEDY